VTAVVARGVGVTLGRVRVVDQVNIDVPTSGWLAVLGSNGAGKSTLLRCLAGLVRHDGSVTFPGIATTAGRRNARRQRARHIAYAPQVPVLPGDMPVSAYVALGRMPYLSVVSAPSVADRAAVAEALDRLDLARYASRPLRTLSGGERQRAVLARAMAQQPQVLLLDEPTASLDLGHAQRVLDLIDMLRLERGLTVVSTLHDLTLAGQYAEVVAVMVDGRLAVTGTPEQVLTSESVTACFGATVEVTAGVSGPRVSPVRR
jgi:iron complex transport system ATP-binding protein